MTKTDIEWLEYANQFHYDNHPEINTAVKHAIEALERTRWIPVSERLPENQKYDWVLVATKMSPEGWYGVPHIAEMRSGVWYCTEVDAPMEETLSIEVTHWMPLPEHPEGV